ncbi:MAG: hypothetical protein WCX12_02180 [Candidatus Paceibacterota bacterium]|jgi:hypothetical protein
MPEITKFQILTNYFPNNFPLDVLLGNMKPKSWQEKRAKFYFEKILELDSVLRKIGRYPLYFLEFYPTSEAISKSEAVEYHWYSYMQDIYILKERIMGIIGSLKNDLSRYNLANPNDANRLLDHLKNNVMSGLKEATKFRDKHTHERTARNFDITRANALSLIKKNAQELSLDIKKLDGKIEELTEKSKIEYADMAYRNNGEMEKLKDFFAPRFGHLFASINGHDHSVFKID